MNNENNNMNNNVNNNVNTNVNPNVNENINQNNVNQQGTVVNPNPSVAPTPVQTSPAASEQPVQTPVVNNNATPTNSNNNDSQGGKGKTFFLILFFIVAIVFVLFLPNISSLLQNGRVSSSSSEVENGTLTCEMENETDNTDTIYEYSLKFTKKKLTTSTYNTTVESEDKKQIEERNKKCEEIKTIAEDIKGIDVTCTSSDNISTTLQSNNHKSIETDLLAKFTEAGGIYPEFEYNKNIYDIQSELVKSGFDCKITAD